MEKKVMASLKRCYSVAPLTYQGEPHILVAAEKKDRCILFDMDGQEKATVWHEPGGVMSMVQVPGKDGQFLATHKFYSPDDSKEAKIVTAFPQPDGRWSVQTLADLPFIHRFDILTSNGIHYLIACTLKSGHEYKEDWRSPGKVYAAVLPDDLSIFDETHQLELHVLKDGMLKNHGYCRVTRNGKESALICCENGIFRFYPPAGIEEDWRIECLLDIPASDAALIDLDQDGKDELIVLSPFHGSEITIFRDTADGFQPVYRYPEPAEFLHAIWCGNINGTPTAVIGHRDGARRLMLFTWDPQKKDFTFRIVDEGCGPANAYGYHWNGKDILVATNREINEIAMYIF